MPASNNTLFYMFQNLAPGREYEVSVSMRNAVGEGPRAYVRVSTPSLPICKANVIFNYTLYFIFYSLT